MKTLGYLAGSLVALVFGLIMLVISMVLKLIVLALPAVLIWFALVQFNIDVSLYGLIFLSYAYYLFRSI